MTFDPSVPNANQSPGLFPPQNSTNFTRLKAIISGDHIFNDTQNVDTDGKHLQVTLLNRATPGSLPAGMNGILFSNTASSVTQLFFYNGTSTVQITPGIVAAANFNGVGVVTPRKYFNVTSVVRDSEGFYTVNFSPTLPDENYIVQITGMRNSNKLANGFVKGDSIYGNSVDTTFVKIGFTGDSGSPVDVLMANVTIMRY